MYATISQILKLLEDIAPLETAENWDNVGLLIGNCNTRVKKVLIALDITEDTVNEALVEEAELVITHHPLIFKGVNKINDLTPLGKTIMKLIKNDIAVISMHTNLDIAIGGTNDTMFDLLELVNKRPLICDNKALGRIGELAQPVLLKHFSEFVARKIEMPHIKYVGDSNRDVTTVGICTGSGMDYYKTAVQEKCDVYITGDVSYHMAKDASDLGMCIIDASHFATEIIVVNSLSQLLNKASTEQHLNTVFLTTKMQKDIFQYI